MSNPAENAEAVGSTDDEFLFSRRKKRHDDGMVAGLNLTAMMDVMTILLVYLIKVYADAPESITLNDDLRPPTSTAPDNMVPSVSVLISKTSVLVDQKLVLKLKPGGVVDAADPSNAYAPLAKALASRVETIKYIEAGGGSPFDGNLMIIADADAPYDLISNVLYHAGKAQFTTYRLVVQKGASTPAR
ncbi:MAG: biopolymer transporter ExbD [Pseudomonadota bacterium]|nr:biopolymer transporter ExbD [Pseudomonadota bacterium]